MRKSNILILLFILLTSSCTAKTAKEDTIKIKPKPKDFNYLKIQTVLPPEDQAYYKRVHNEISEIGKHFAYREKNAQKKYCPILEKMFDEISVRPISREREREREK
jgi:hypothetical protein